MSIINIINVFIFALIILKSSVYGQPSMSVNNLDFFDMHERHVYIVDLRKDSNKQSPLVITCNGGPRALDLNLTFTGLDSTIQRVPSDQIDVPGSKKLELTLNQPLQSVYTGRYNCTARYENDVVETISWYIYFYPGKSIRQ